MAMKYDETENILELFMHCAGESEVPRSWMKWTCISMVAAALADRVYYRKLAWKTLPPNMYIMLIGDSGLGKGNALDFGLQFKHSRMNLLYGSATKQSLIDRMCAPLDEQMGDVSNAKIFIVQDELAEALGSGQLADAYVKALTGWYGATANEIEENTRTHGRKLLEEPPCINWLAGTTNEWLRDCIDYKAMMSGFFGRVCTVPGSADYDRRVYDPVIVRDYEPVVSYLKDRFEELTWFQGEMMMLPQALDLDKDWYETRPKPSECMAPFWRREHALILKLAMILSACDSLDLQIHPKHILGAQELVREVRSYMPTVIETAAKGGVVTVAERVKRKIGERKNGISRTETLRWVGQWGVRAAELTDVVNYLVDQDYIYVVRRGSKIYYQIKERPVIDWAGLGTVD